MQRKMNPQKKNPLSNTLCMFSEFYTSVGLNLGREIANAQRWRLTALTIPKDEGRG
jgi:hypothetical protein